MLLVLVIMFSAYLIGSIPFGYVVAKAVKGIDIREHGSRNIGATNVGRVIGWPWFAVVFLLDFSKGAGPVGAMAFGFGPAAEATGMTDLALATLTALTVMLGHLYPLYLQFRGGKGVATGAGAVVVLVPIPAAVAIAVFLLVLGATRYVSLGSILAALALVATQFAWHGTRAFDPQFLPATVFTALGAGLVIVRHRANIGRLLRGTENRIGG